MSIRLSDYFPNLYLTGYNTLNIIYALKSYFIWIYAGGKNFYGFITTSKRRKRLCLGADNAGVFGRHGHFLNSPPEIFAVD